MQHGLCHIDCECAHAPKRLLGRDLHVHYRSGLVEWWQLLLVAQTFGHAVQWQALSCDTSASCEFATYGWSATTYSPRTYSTCSGTRVATLAGGASLDDLWGVVRLTSCHTLEGSHGMQRETWSLRNTLPRILNGVALPKACEPNYIATTATSVSTTTSTDHCAHITRYPRCDDCRMLRPAHPRHLPCTTAAATAHCGVARMPAALLSWDDAGPCERLAWAVHSGNTMS